MESICLAGSRGQEPDPQLVPGAVPLYQTTPTLFKSAEHGANLFGLKSLATYTRARNPTTDVLGNGWLP